MNNTINKNKDKEFIKIIKKLNKKHKGEISHPNNPNYLFELTNVSKQYCNGYLVNDVLKEINLKIEHGKLVVILGKSGSGKTTLMNILSGLTRATTGSVVVDNKQLINMSNNELINFRRKNVGYIFQEYGLLPTLNVYENVLTGFNLNKKNRNKKEIYEILNMVGLQNLDKKFPNQLSGGQQQRVAIARAIAKKPKMIFGDEPTGALDSKMSKTILSILQKINKELKTTIILITHDTEVTKIADRVIRIENGEIKEDKT